MNLPKEYENVMVTFEGSVRVRDKYYDHYEKSIVTLRGFYHKSDGYYNGSDQWIDTPNGYFSVPPDWRMFNGSLLPHGWGGYRVLPENVIKYEAIKKEENGQEKTDVRHLQ